jgi:predicted nuclease of predicted toxin-antitoxin system
VVQFFADECVAVLIVEGLRRLGYDVASAYDLCRGEPDSNVLTLASAAGRVLIAEDWGFGELAVRRNRPAVGVIVLSLYQLPAGAREQYAVERIAEVADRAPGHLAVIEPGRIRRRPLPAPEHGEPAQPQPEERHERTQDHP